ncbi:hypothetical protein EVAR_11923_1 [Eumeta japonica]|uniref:Uncharacterized protein n=1 Tax=Eumeta variegata TaxID=151549 RepID=A0A4C1U8G9_EUMVA|nr:hypothetical protein EVAR_11923_1 [Eumeta japonica]
MGSNLWQRNNWSLFLRKARGQNVTKTVSQTSVETGKKEQTLRTVSSGNRDYAGGVKKITAFLARNKGKRRPLKRLLVQQLTDYGISHHLCNLIGLHVVLVRGELRRRRQHGRREDARLRVQGSRRCARAPAPGPATRHGPARTLTNTYASLHVHTTQVYFICTVDSNKTKISHLQEEPPSLDNRPVHSIEAAAIYCLFRPSRGFRSAVGIRKIDRRAPARPHVFNLLSPVKGLHEPTPAPAVPLPEAIHARRRLTTTAARNRS